MNRDSEQKSADRGAFEHYLRTGRCLTAAQWLAQERKFNPYHDPENGRFTFAPGGSGSAVSSASMASRRNNGGKPYPARIVLPNPSQKRTDKLDADATQRPHTPPTPRFRHSAGLDLPDPVVAQANALSDSVRLRTGHRIFVTSGRRPPDRQAAAMYDNYVDKTPPRHANRSAELEVRQAYVQGRRAGKDRDQTIRDMTNVLTAQARRGIFISRHMRSGAIDIRTPPANVLSAIRNHPMVESVGVENDHIHIQFR